MTIAPILVMNGILIVLTLLLLVADKFLVSYGDCKITVKHGEEKQEFTVQGGNSLLSVLIDHKIDVSSSCAGRATCGYCKVRVEQGGGPILPTEEIFMSRREQKESMRLACQVKVKNDVDIVIPDYLVIVREMVKNKKFNPDQKWLVTVK
ncbi:MAG: 2Fe-2S iron-sulfur cluster binding domain-containing protein [bacterium]|nr:2Fe-2S iron-sulfur cluster binding domain-containing protein [bacterium]